MLRNTIARFRSVRLRITVIATVLTGVALTVSAVLLVSAVESRLEDQVREDTRRAADKVAVALQAGQPVDKAVAAPALGTYVYIVGDSGDVLAASTGPVGGGVAAVGPLPDPSLLSGGAP